MLTLNAGIKKWNNIREFYRLLSTVYIKIHDNDKLFDIYQRALKIWPNDLDFSVQLAQFYEEIKAYDKAKMIYEKILQQEPKHDVAANNLAALLLEQYYNQINAAKALELTRRFENSSNPYALDTYAWALFKNGKNVQALNFLKFVIAQEPKKAIFNYHLGVVYLKIQENKLALKFLETAIQLGQNDVDFDNTNHAQELLAELKRSIKH
jgi:tetratricopeptide (TPR) repeat protein